MPAVPAATIITKTSASSTDSISTSSLSSLGTVQQQQAFTILKDEDDSEGLLSSQPINIIETDDDIDYLHVEEEEEDYSAEKIGRQFRTSRPDQQCITSSNVHLLEKKLMDLSQSNGSLEEQRLFTRTNAYLRNKVNNNLKNNKVISKSISHINQTPQKKLKKDSSKSHSNLQKHQQKNNNLYQNHKEALKGYHRNCYTSTSVYSSRNNMTSSVRQPPIYNRDFSSISDSKSQQNGIGGRRKSSPESDNSMSPFNSINNNSINAKNRQNENNNRFFKNQLNNTKNSVNYRMNNQNNNNKPLFVTTVKTGKFLDPPPELAYLLGLNVNTSVSSLNDSSNSLEGSVRDRHQQQVLLYSFSSQPRVLHQHHHKARCEAAVRAATKTNDDPPPQQRTRRHTTANEQDGPVPYGNIMFDRRVVRGSTFAQHPIPQPKWNPYFGYAKLLSQTDSESQAARQQEARRRALARRRAQGQQTRNARLRVGTPPPVAGRRHETAQTEKYLEELFDRPTESHIGVQTDLFLDRPESPLYVPAKTGVDAETQIYPGDLFDFDLEVQPILEVLVGKTLEQAMLEVLEEEELAALRAQQRRYLDLRAGEKAEELRLEEQERRLREEKERRLKQHEEAAIIQKETEDRIAAAVLTHGYLADLLPSVLEGLKEAGYVLDDIKADVAENFMPWLMNEVQQEMDNMVSSRDILTDMVREILETRAEIYRVMGEEDAAKLGLSDVEEPIMYEPSGELSDEQQLEDIVTLPSEPVLEVPPEIEDDDDV
ncbi:uncharacterized protein Rsph3 [Anabrus simplex]|uniref:uncharacterized protein Rsph3 n=1 Tax=Anabrus simplex TaxID=316456 RepID=UPI0035A316CB